MRDADVCGFSLLLAQTHTMLRDRRNKSEKRSSRIGQKRNRLSEKGYSSGKDTPAFPDKDLPKSRKEKTI